MATRSAGILALLALASADWVGAGPASYWIGTDDLDADGIWKDATGVQATFDGAPVVQTLSSPPWATGEPDSQGGSGSEHCVFAQTSTSQWFDAKCDAGNVKAPAVCECTP